MCLALCVLLTLALLWPGRRAPDLEVIEVSRARAWGIETNLRAGSHDWRPPAVAAADPQLDRDVAGAWRQGLPIVASLTAWRQALTGAATLVMACRSLQLLLWSRAAMGLGLASLVRLWLTTGPLFAFTRVEVGSALASCLPAACGQLWLRRLLPRPWQLSGSGKIFPHLMVSGGRSRCNKPQEYWLHPCAYDWLRAHLFGTAFAPLPAGKELDIREFRQGVSLLAEKRELLMEWSSAATLAGTARLQRLADWLPVFELLGIGLPMVVLLAPPLLASLAEDLPS